VHPLPAGGAVERLRAVKKLPRPLALALLSILLVLLAAGFELLRFAGSFDVLKPEFAGACQSIALAGSSEDIQIDRARGIAYLSYLDRAGSRRGETVSGSIMLLDLNLRERAPRAAMSFDPADFRPHGMSLWQQPGQPARLFSISHISNTEHGVEIAEQGASGFVPVATIRDPAFENPNAIAAVGPDQFYLVNDRPRQSARQDRMTTLLRKRNGSLVFHDGAKAITLLSDLRYPVGLALSPDRSRIYIAEATGKALRILRRDPANGIPALEEVVDLGTAPDNLNVDDDGVVWMAAHPKLLSFIAHVEHPQKRSPTLVLRFDPDGAEPRLRQVYLDDGTQISAGTVAARWRDEFLIGALLDKKVLICKPNP
jgi:arylesterase/paraoxonase